MHCIKHGIGCEADLLVRGEGAVCAAQGSGINRWCTADLAEHPLLFLHPAVSMPCCSFTLLSRTPFYTMCRWAAAHLT